MGGPPSGAGASVLRARHWDSTYEGRGDSAVSWFQAVPEVSLALIETLEVTRSAAVIDIGGGASFLVDHLLERRFSDVSVLDISDIPLGRARRRIGSEVPVSWIHQDVLTWRPRRRYGLWHDRAVLHFLVEGGDRDAYFARLRRATGPLSAVVIGTFAPDAPDTCSGLPVARYSAYELEKLLGHGFKVLEVRGEEHVTPEGAIQPFTWVGARVLGS